MDHSDTSDFEASYVAWRGVLWRVVWFGLGLGGSLVYGEKFNYCTKGSHVLTVFFRPLL